MIIPINVASSSSNLKLPPGLAKISHDEVVLIELQGALEVDSNQPNERDGKLVGKLNFEESTNKSTLLIGHHLLEGKISNIPKPLAVLVRSKAPSNSTTVSGMGALETEDVEDVEMLQENDQETPSSMDLGWDMVALVKRKIVFSKRPMPVVNLTSRTT
ncbi:hypothetical protein H0H93_000764 [Arthromyces matolae]|nr:hypothetical protein H0H93_000764 [Arthromyces matolae]